MPSRLDTVPATLSSRLLRWAARLALIAAVAALALWVHLYELNGVNTWDAAYYLTFGKLLQGGMRLYRDLWELKPPGIFMYLTAVFTVLPVAVWSVRLTDYLLYVAAGVAFYRLCSVEARWPLALAGTAMWLFFAHHPVFNNWGFYTEEYASMAAIVAVAASAHYWRAGGLGWVALGGVAAAVAVIFKQPGAACGVPAVVLISGRRPLRALPLFVLCGALPILLVIAYFWGRGSLAEFLECNLYAPFLRSGLQHSGGAGVTARLQQLLLHSWGRFAPYPELLWPTLLGAVVCAMHPTRLRVAALGWLAADLLMIVPLKEYHEHYYISTFASATLVSVLGAAWLLQRRPGERWVYGALRFAACAAAVWIVWPRLQAVIAERQPGVAQGWATVRAGPSAWPRHPGGPYEAELGAYLNARTAPADRLFIFDIGTSVATYWNADRRPASRYLWPDLLWNLWQPNRMYAYDELERNRPAYILIAGDPAYRDFTPFLLENYTLAKVAWRDARVEIWGRREYAPFAAGTLRDLSDEAVSGGLVLTEPHAGAADPLTERDELRRGTWTSPVIEVAGGGDDLMLDWNPRADLAANPGGSDYPRAAATAVQPPDDPKAVLGTPTLSGRLTILPRPQPQTLSVDLGFDAVADHVVLRRVKDPNAMEHDRLQILAAAGGDFAPVEGTWEVAPDGASVYRFAPQVLSALRIVATPSRPLGLERVEVPAVGMGVVMRYRTGPTPDLAAAPWVAIADGEGPRTVPAQRYVQIQPELWSRYAGLSPVVRWLQVGRLQFNPGAGQDPAAALRTAAGSPSGSASDTGAPAAAPPRRRIATISSLPHT